jgi:hypothetical protein
MGIRVAPAVRKVLHELAGGIADGLPRRGEAGPFKRALLVLPAGSPWPNVEGAELICDALTRILATAWVKPSGVRICAKGAGRRAHTWRLPGALQGQ